MVATTEGGILEQEIFNNKIIGVWSFFVDNKKFIHIKTLHLSIKYNYNMIQWKFNEFQEQ